MLGISPWGVAPPSPQPSRSGIIDLPLGSGPGRSLLHTPAAGRTETEVTTACSPGHRVASEVGSPGTDTHSSAIHPPSTIPSQTRLVDANGNRAEHDSETLPLAPRKGFSFWGEESENRFMTDPTPTDGTSADGTSKSPSPKPVRTVPWVATAPERGERLVMLTAYDYPQARAADAADVDLVLVGDSLAMVVLGHPDTLSVTVDEMLHHVRAVRRGVERALLVADMPFGSFHLGPAQAVENAVRFVKEAGAQGVKIEGARTEVVRALVAAEIPVMAHLGLTPQSLHKLGGFRVQGREEDARAAMLEAAEEMQEAGAFSLVLECVPADLAAEVTERLDIPTIGIGAGAQCDGQVLVFHDLLGWTEGHRPRFVRRYAEQGDEAREAIARYAAEVRSGAFPSDDESYGSGPRPVTAPAPPLKKVYG